MVIQPYIKGDIKDLGDYQLTNKAKNSKDQPRLNFRNGYSTIDYKQEIDKTSKYNKILCLAYVEYEKPCLETRKSTHSLQQQGII